MSSSGCRNSKGIDYSKWDHIDDSDSSDVDDDEGNRRPVAVPQVTRLETASRVTFGKGMAEITPQSSASTTSGPTTTKLPSSSLSVSQTKSVTDPMSTLPRTNTLTSKLISTWAEHGGTATLSARNGKEPRTVYWSQDRYSVCLRIQLLDQDAAVSSIPSKPFDSLQVFVQGILPYSDRCCAMGTTQPQLIVRYQCDHQSSVSESDCIVIQETLPHAVHRAQEDEDDEDLVVHHGQSNHSNSKNNVDWSIERDDANNTPYVCLTLYKAVPMQGMFIWWKRPFLSVPEAEWDTTSSTQQQQQQSERATALQDAWQEAHRLFQERRRQHETSRENVTKIQ